MSMDEKCRTFIPEIWGGIESSINRIGDQYRDQLQYAGHYRRPRDIDLFASLGIRALRYPILWERHAPSQLEPTDWSWITQQLEKIRENDMVPIAGLLHHGSGPAYTDLLDENFPLKFAEYAGAVAQQFPWLEYYTPVNEPLTTARFSGLYGIWYPHLRNEKAFLKMLINQVKGIILAMQEIRKINPAAKLVQTEDLSKTHSTALLSYQADFENERRWLTYDLLCGMVKPGHFFFKYFLSYGISKEELSFIAENKCAPDIMGFNYYVTSERYLDENLQNYPPHTHGGNGRHHFVDTEAVRCDCMQGISVLLKEAWQRYGLPLAITETHLSCTREEQSRWFYETWAACCQLKNEGVDIRAVTAWSLLGAYDWDSLLAQHNLSYEVGVFDARQQVPRSTLLAQMIRSLSAEGSFSHPLLNQRGWWHPQCASRGGNDIAERTEVLIVGENNALAKLVAQNLRRRSIPYRAVRGSARILAAYIERYLPWAVIDAHTAGQSREDAHIIARDCRNRRIHLLSFTDAYDHHELPVFPGMLLIRYEQENNLPVNLVMDLLIDEEKGLWEMSAEGVLIKMKKQQKKLVSEK